eukprot:m.209336 g.209336  ORF g.209336 m.209336 type:complete len:121 (+) comp10134_c0_seq46:2173-2535(+)
MTASASPELSREREVSVALEEDMRDTVGAALRLAASADWAERLEAATMLRDSFRNAALSPRDQRRVMDCFIATVRIIPTPCASPCPRPVHRLAGAVCIVLPTPSCRRCVHRIVLIKVQPE